MSQTTSATHRPPDTAEDAAEVEHLAAERLEDGPRSAQLTAQTPATGSESGFSDPDQESPEHHSPRSEKQGPREILRNRKLTTLMLGHFTVDMYAGLIPVLFPLLTDRFDLDLKTVGLVSLAYTGVASLSQPFFGWIADRYGTRLTNLTLAWTALAFATVGFAPNFPLLLIIAAAAGLGSGAFHPLGAVNANAVIPANQRNLAMSIYITGGTLGVATGPLAGAILFGWIGMSATLLMALPGLVVAAWLTTQMSSIALQRPNRGVGGVLDAPPIPYKPLAIVVGVMMLRMWVIFGIQAFVPTWYEDLGYGPTFYGALATTIVLASAVGAIGSGSLADRYGRRAVIQVTQILTIPVIFLFATFTGPIGFVTGAAIGLLGASTGPLLLVLAQQLMRGRAGMATGVILGLGFVTGSIGVPVLGALGDAIGIADAIRYQIVVVIATIALTHFLPTEAPDPRPALGAAPSEMT